MGGSPASPAVCSHSILAPNRARKHINHCVCTHKSFLDLHAKHYPLSPAHTTNAILASFGNAFMGPFGFEHPQSRR
ncbi:hypothetical protein J3A83DRAFT_4297266 [Scleroderma citrinum]